MIAVANVLVSIILLNNPGSQHASHATKIISLKIISATEYHKLGIATAE